MKIEELSPAARSAVETKKITGGWDGKSLVKLFAELDRWDNMAEGRKKSAQRVFVGGCIFMVLGVFAAFVVADQTESIWGIAACILVPIGITALGAKLKNAARAIDLPNELRLTLRPVLRQLKQDLHPDEKIKVNLNLAGLDESKPATEREYPSPRGGKIKEKTFVDDLGELRLPLIDGSTAVIRLENSYIEAARSYRTARGKYKTKTKWKKLATATTILIPPARINWQSGKAAQMVDPNSERVTFSEKDGVMVARLDRYYKFKKAGDAPEDTVPGSHVIDMLVRLSAMRPQAAGGAQ
jgi:hypothetical protein